MTHYCLLRDERGVTGLCNPLAMKRAEEKRPPAAVHWLSARAAKALTGVEHPNRPRAGPLFLLFFSVPQQRHQEWPVPAFPFLFQAKIAREWQPVR
ncbi:hypothetical protein EpCFBP13511_02090 [Erwinia persicina]|uniref:Uncharacterized protein n=1 Tax=Erwinia persicina TaxID=55211 RepID=A0A4V5UAV9_9GAMM|nr:hypothetical protein EpCFBP13511_02090 [Erwinia persicina]